MRKSGEERAIVRRRVRFACDHDLMGAYSAPGVESGGRFRKRHPADCGRSRCHVCHGDKLYGKLSKAIKAFREAADLQVADLS